MANDGQIVFEVTADGKHAIADIKEITRAIQQETGKWDDAARQSSDSINANFSGMLKKLAAGISAAKIGQTLLNIGKEAVAAASDLEEVQNVVDVTFGSGAGKIESWAKAAGSQFGLTETQAKKFTSTLGAMMKSSGLAGEEIVDMSTDLAGLAADMASFYNLDFDTAFQKIRSGISGETEPLKQLGINMSVANLNAYALQQGLGKTFEQMTQGEQTMLRYQYLMQATADAQGDFSRTSDGYANSLRTLETNIESIKTALGKTFIGVVTEATGAINEFLKILAPEEKPRTVLDDFADIDLQTERKLEQIRTTAEEASALAAELESIGGAGTSTAGAGVQKLVDDLSNIKLDQGKAGVVKDFLGVLSGNIEALAAVQGTDADGARAWLENVGQAADSLDPNDAKGWQDLINTIKQGLPGLENTDFGSDFFASLNGIEIGEKAQKIKSFISDLSGDISKVAALRGEDADGAREWLEGIAESANTLNPDDAQGWADLLAQLKDGLPGLENTDFGKNFLASLGEGFTGVEGKTSVLEWAIDSLGNKTARTAEEQALWLETCKRLVKTIPGLSSIINTETGEVNGGTQAVKDYIKAWEEGQTKLVMLGALEQKEDALSQRFSDLPGLQLDKLVAERRVRKAREELEKIFDKYGTAAFEGSHGRIDRGFESSYILTKEQKDEMKAAADEYERLYGEAEKAAEAYKTQADALEEAKAAIEEYRKTVQEMPGIIEQAATESEKFWTDNADNIKVIVAAASDAINALEDHVDGVRKSAEQAVDSVAKGLGKVSYREYGETIEKISELTAQQAKEKVGSEKWLALEKQIQKANESLVNTENIMRNLKSQSDFLDDYLANLQKGREMGLSNELLAELSDGSVESAQYLAEIVNADAGTAAEIDKTYQEVQKKKKDLAAGLADQQLTVDQTYQTLAAKAKEAVAALDLQEEAKKNSGATIAGVASGISEHVSDVKTAVDSIIEQLNRLNGYGINIDFGGFGEINFTTTTGEKAEGSGRMGLDFVPHDDYIARLHEGERVLTAQENQVWNALRNGGVAGFDLEALGGVMRDNVKPGGNVYLDSRVVGQVISDQQGKSFRQLQRSGWQG